MENLPLKDDRFDLLIAAGIIINIILMTIQSFKPSSWQQQCSLSNRRRTSCTLCRCRCTSCLCSVLSRGPRLLPLRLVQMRKLPLLWPTFVAAQGIGCRLPRRRPSAQCALNVLEGDWPTANSHHIRKLAHCRAHCTCRTESFRCRVTECEPEPQRSRWPFRLLE